MPIRFGTSAISYSHALAIRMERPEGIRRVDVQHGAVKCPWFRLEKSIIDSGRRPAAIDVFGDAVESPPMTVGTPLTYHLLIFEMSRFIYEFVVEILRSDGIAVGQVDVDDTVGAV